MGIGNRIKEAREALCLTQEELGRKVGVTGSSITNYEKEVSHPKEGILYSLFRELNVDPNYLFQDYIRIKEPLKSTEAEQQLIQIYKNLNEVGQEKLMDYAEDIAMLQKYKKCSNSEGLG